MVHRRRRSRVYDRLPPPPSHVPHVFSQVCRLDQSITQHQAILRNSQRRNPPYLAIFIFNTRNAFDGWYQRALRQSGRVCSEEIYNEFFQIEQQWANYRRQIRIELNN
nr:13180_t:CDS:2 [Entrophospora candida]